MWKSVLIPPMWSRSRNVSVRSDARRLGCVSSAAARAAQAGENVRFAGLVTLKHRHPRPSGGHALLATLEDEEGLIEALVPARRYGALSPYFAGQGPLVVDAVSVRDGEHVHLDVRDAAPFRPQTRQRLR